MCLSSMTNSHSLFQIYELYFAVSILGLNSLNSVFHFSHPICHYIDIMVFTTMYAQVFLNLPLNLAPMPELHIQITKHLFSEYKLYPLIIAEKQSINQSM